MKLKCIFIVLLFLPVVLFAGNDNNCHRTTEGTDFWFGFMENRIYKAEYHTLQIVVSALESTTFNITVGLPAAPTFSRNYNVLANEPLTVEIPWEIAQSKDSEIIQNKGIHLSSAKPVRVFAINWDPNSTDISAIYPVSSLGKEYLAMCYYPHIDPSNPLSGAGRNSEFLIVATENQTIVNITPSKVTDKLIRKDSTFQRVLQQGEVLQVQSENIQGSNKNGQGDLTGSRVEADKPVAFFSGALSTTVPNTQCCWDHLYEQIPPIQSWGREYFTVPFKSRTRDCFRILAASDNTTIQISGGSFIYLNRGEFKEFELSAKQASHILSDKPVLVAQFSQSNSVDSAFTNGNGDPFMIILNQVGRGVTNTIFKTFETPKSVADSAYRPFDKNYVNIISPTKEIPNIRLDQLSIETQFIPYADGNFSFAQIEIEKGNHMIENVAKTEGFTAYVYGFGGYESYGFGAGYNLDVSLDLGKSFEFFTGDTILLCYGNTLQLDAGPQFDTYKWIMGEETQSIRVTGEKLYGVEAATNDGCILYDSVFVKVSKPVAEIGDRYETICYPNKVLLSGGSGYQKYTWQNQMDEIISSEQNLLASKTGEYRLTVTDKYHCSARDTLGLTVYPVPKIQITGNHLVCGDTKTQLSATITGTPDSIWNLPGNYFWSTSSPDLILSDSIRYFVKIETSKWGDFEIYYKLITRDGCDTTVTFPIRFHPQPKNTFEINDDPVCSGYSKVLRFTGDASNAAFFDWNLHGRTFLDTIDLQKRIYLISTGAVQSDDLPVSLAINDKGCVSDTISQIIPNPKSNFSIEADKTRGCDSLEVNFTGKMLNTDKVNYSWTFDENDRISGQTTKRNYTEPGFFKVKLTIVNPDSRCINSLTIDSLIKVFPTPIAQITTDASICYPGFALLDYKNSIDSTWYFWEFNNSRVDGFYKDSVILSMDNPFEKVVLTVNEFGCVSSPDSIWLKRIPFFDFSSDITEGCQPLTVKTQAITIDKFLDFQWITDSLPYPVDLSNIYLFPDTGRFDIGLIATSSDTYCADTLIKSDYIRVHKKPLAKFEVDYPIALLENANITYINYSKNAVNYYWNFGDSATSIEKAPVHTFTKVGSYLSQLISESEFGCTDSSDFLIQIIPSKVYAPNAFRPNSEIDENRTFMPIGIGVDMAATFNMKIYNRWGEMIFETNSSLKPWDGKLKNGEMAPGGNYVWIAFFVDIQGIEHHEKGQIMLIR